MSDTPAVHADELNERMSLDVGSPSHISMEIAMDSPMYASLSTQSFDRPSMDVGRSPLSANSTEIPFSSDGSLPGRPSMEQFRVEGTEDGEEEEEEGSDEHGGHGGAGGPTPAIANIVNCILAAGAVSGAYALASAGFFLGIFMYLLTTVVMDFSVVLLAKIATATHCPNYQTLCRKALGLPGYIIISLAQWGQGYGCMVAYIMIAGDTLRSMLTLLPDVPEICFDRRLIMLALLFVVLPICFLKQISSLGKISYMSILSVLYIAACLLIRTLFPVAVLATAATDDSSSAAAAAAAATTTTTTIVTTEADKVFSIARLGFLDGLGVAAFSFVTHHEALMLFKSLKPRSLTTWEYVVHYSMLVSCGVLLLIGVSGYLLFYEESSSNILKNFPDSDWLIASARALFGMTLVLTFPLEHFIARATALQLVAQVRKKKTNSNLEFIILTLCHVVPAAAIAAFTTDVGVVLTLTGGVCASCLAYVMPGVLYIRLAQNKTVHPTRVFSYVLAFAGLCLMISSPSWVVYKILSGASVSGHGGG